MSGDDDFAGHSKAPWHYSPTHYGKAFAIGAADGDNVALVYGPEENGSDFFRANARLIASAPSLLAENQRLRAQVAGLREALVEAINASSAAALPWAKLIDEAAQYPYSETWVRFCRDAARAALAVAEPAVRAGERDEIIALIEATPTPGEADDTESGHRYAAGYRDASNCAADDLRRLRDRVVARTGGTP